jgi:ABC-type transport system substrate-binding protein
MVFLNAIKKNYIVILLLIILVGCTAQAPTTAPTSVQLTYPETAIPSSTPTHIPVTNKPIPPTGTPVPTSTETPLPTPTNTSTPTPIPGVQVIPISSMKNAIPWLPIVTTARPCIFYLGFNTLKPPFDNPTVRQAFAAALDRQEFVDLFLTYYPEYKPRTATSLTPPETLGRDLTGVVGIPYNLELAKTLLEQAGYTDPAKFPTATLFSRATIFTEYPGFRDLWADAVTDKWLGILGVKVNFSVTTEKYSERFMNNPPDIFILGLVADVNDPDNFMSVFLSKGEINYGKFSNVEFDRLIRKAAGVTDPLSRQLLYIEAETIFTQQEVGIIPLTFVTRNIP